MGGKAKKAVWQRERGNEEEKTRCEESDVDVIEVDGNEEEDHEE